MEYRGIDHNLTEMGERGTFIRRENTGGAATAWEHLYHMPLHTHSLPPPKQCKHVEEAPPDAGKVWEKKIQNSSLTPKYRTEQFLNDFYDFELDFLLN